jgi:uncharacterized protein
MRLDRRDCLVAMTGLMLSSRLARAGTADIDPPLRLAEGANRSQIYLLGGAAPRDRSWFTSKIERAIKECTTLWQEDPPKPNAFNRELNIELSRRSGGTLFDDLTDAEEARVLKAAKTLDIPLDSLRIMKPWGAGAVIAFVSYNRPNAAPPADNAQLFLQNIALDRGIPVKSEMAEWDDWVRFYAAFPQKAAVQYMLYQIDLSELPPDAVARWSDRWLKGDESAWERFNQQWREQYPDLYEVLEVQRNEKWVDRIVDMIASGGTHLINVGVQHTVGPNSIQALAARRGVNFRRI